eukprot:185272-Chlamydomonas_euryale.AAC.1
MAEPPAPRPPPGVYAPRRVKRCRVVLAAAQRDSRRRQCCRRAQLIDAHGESVDVGGAGPQLVVCAAAPR